MATYLNCASQQRKQQRKKNNLQEYILDDSYIYDDFDRYGKRDTRSLIIGELMKAIVRLVSHKLAATVVDYAIMTAAEERTRRLALQYLVSRKYITQPKLHVHAEGEEEEDTKDDAADDEADGKKARMPYSLLEILKEMTDEKNARLASDRAMLLAAGSSTSTSSSSSSSSAAIVDGMCDYMCLFV